MKASAAVASRASADAAHGAGPYLRLQRQCKCGAADSGLAGTCEDCAAKRLQPKLTIGPVNDRYEQEADRAADAVMRAPAAGRNVAGSISPLVQRSEAGAEPATGERSAGARPAVPAQVRLVFTSPGRPLDAATRAFFEPRFGHDFRRVRVHHDGAAAAAARAVDAHAYTVGEHVVFGHGRYAPDSGAGRRLLAHELTHVVQQQGGVLRRASISPPLRGGVPGEEEQQDRETPGPEEEPVQQLQRVPAIVGLDEAGPNADLSGRDEGPKLARIGECLKSKGPDPNECTPTAALSWADFSATPNMSSKFAAGTKLTIKKVDVPSQQCVRRGARPSDRAEAHLPGRVRPDEELGQAEHEERRRPDEERQRRVRREVPQRFRRRHREGSGRRDLGAQHRAGCDVRVERAARGYARDDQGRMRHDDRHRLHEPHRRRIGTPAQARAAPLQADLRDGEEGQRAALARRRLRGDRCRDPGDAEDDAGPVRRRIGPRLHCGRANQMGDRDRQRSAQREAAVRCMPKPAASRTVRAAPRVFRVVVMKRRHLAVPGLAKPLRAGRAARRNNGVRPLNSGPSYRDW